MLYEDYRREKMQALKNKDTFKNKVITGLMSDMTYKMKEKGQDLSEEECQAVVQKALKKAQEAYDLAASRPDKQEEMAKEIDILKGFLPEQLTAEAVQAKVNDLFADLSPQEANKGMLMGKAMGALKGLADGRVISDAVDAWLKKA
ncbi:GatB/YqeY domain-containing protein [Peptococcus simiae]|uniref:GatB/YqeY domain-containing protein n=1 Tax=Peptococcus simiae TaxID=1643805 RepID=A0ABW9H0J6_9FIRM